MTYSCIFHSLPAFDTPPLGWSIAIIFPEISIESSYSLMIRAAILLCATANCTIVS